MVKIVISVKGGIVQHVSSTETIEYKLIDEDIEGCTTWENDELISEEEYEKLCEDDTLWK